MKWAALLWFIAANLVRLPTPLVRIESGLVRGRISSNGKFYQYFGIPYGTVNDTNRFQGPLPPPTWSGVLEAQEENTLCPQLSLGVIVLGETDCLKLNIFSPVPSNKLKPVMVFIHGGCFFSGTGSPVLYGGDFFAEHDVVLVGINYRLDVEGFLCLGIKEAPGNAGLKDQIAALKWIRRNIEAFGGNPNDVTLFGESAGAVSTSLLMLSPAAEGLFHKAILQSGSSLAPWALQHDPIDTASNLVKILGYDTKNPKEILKILSKRTTKELINTSSFTRHKMDKHSENKFCVTERNLFVPCVEKPIEGVESIITEYPADIIISGNYTKIPMIVGNTDKEGMLFVSSEYGSSLKNNSIIIDPMRSLQSDLQFPTEFDKNCTADIIKRHYFSSHEEEMIFNMVDLYSDVHFKFPQVLESELYSRTTDKPIYYYMFRYNGFLNLVNLISGFGLKDGASHADELFYLFKAHLIPLPNKHLDNNMIERMVTLWTNFAKYNDPTPSTSKLMPFRWCPSRSHNPIALVITAEPTTAPMWDETTVSLWNDTYNKYRRRGYGFKQFQDY